MKRSFKPVSRKKDIVVQELKDETLIYDLKSNKAYCLNETSALVWELCDGKRSASEISNEMSKKMKTLISEDFVMIALDQFNKDELLNGNGEKNDHFGGLSRREVIRKVGFATVVALPIVSSIVAPQAMMAQSAPGLAPGATCSGGDCASGFCNPRVDVVFTLPTTRSFIFPGGTVCCNNGPGNTLIPNANFCSPSACNSITNMCCSGTASAAATPQPVCQNISQNTCSCP